MVAWPGHGHPHLQQVYVYCVRRFPTLCHCYDYMYDVQPFILSCPHRRFYCFSILLLPTIILDVTRLTRKSYLSMWPMIFARLLLTFISTDLMSASKVNGLTNATHSFTVCKVTIQLLKIYCILEMKFHTLFRMNIKNVDLLKWQWIKMQTLQLTSLWNNLIIH